MKISSALLSLLPNAKFGIEDNDYDKIQWLDERPLPSREEVMAEVERLVILWENTEYRRLRQPEYPNLADQLDMLWHAIDQNKLDTTSDFYQSLKAIKDKYPK